MPDRAVDHLIVGGGLAGASCARKLRDEGAEGSILVVGREADPPYDRPPLSKDYLRGESDRRAAYVLEPEWWDENDVELLTRTSAMKLDIEARTVKLSNKEEVGFDKLLLATGSNVRRLRVDGSDLEGIHYLRAFGNADSIRDDVESAEQVVLIGGSYIGTEVAASLTAMGKSATILMQEEVTLERSFGVEVGRWFQAVLEDHGVEVCGGDELARFEGEGRVAGVVTGAGRVFDCECVVVGAGVTPDVMLAQGAGLEIGESGGVPCDDHLETTVPGVYVAGDIAECDSPLHGRRLRVEHWDVARAHGETVALNMLGRDVAHEETPYFFSDLADWASLEYVGRGSGGPIVRGSMEEGEFSVFYVDEGRVTAALSVGRSDDLEHARRLIRHRSSVDTAALADTGRDLAEF